MNSIVCPNCSTEIELTEALKKNISKNLEAEFQKNLSKSIERERIRIKQETSEEISSLSTKLHEAQKAELELRKKTRDLEEREKSLELEVQRTLDSEREKVRSALASQIAEEHKLKEAEKDKKLADTLKQLEEMKRKMELGSQKLQGEVMELEFESFLKNQFPFDTIAPVASGVKGGDLLHVVRTQSGTEVGKILWELKRTKSFSSSWIDKLKSDGRNAKADILLLASEALPEDVKGFKLIDGVWISALDICFQLCTSLRFALLQVHQLKAVQKGKQEKSEVVYDYITGNEFKGRIEAIVTSYISMKDDLDTEKRAMEKIWAKREKQIGLVTLNLAGMYGDFEAVLGNALPNIPKLQLENK